MARLDLPESEHPEIVTVWGLRPEMGQAVQGLSHAVYEQSQLPARVREAARMRIAQINDCSVCRGWRIEKLAAEGVDEELYAHVARPGSGGVLGAGEACDRVRRAVRAGSPLDRRRVLRSAS